MNRKEEHVVATRCGEERRQVSMWLPVLLLERIDACAAKQRRTRTAQVIAVLEAATDGAGE